MSEQNLNTASRPAVYNRDGVNINEAPEGFTATLKIESNTNICLQCDARSLCAENANNWCKLNRCMASAVVCGNGENRETVQRKDGKSVVFKRIEK